MYKYCVYPDELYHFGVKGMKWGVRRNRDNVSSNKPHKKWSEKSPSEKQETITKIEKAAAITAVAGLAAYAAVKIGREYCDGSLKSGATLKVVANSDTKDFGRAFYATANKTDQLKYKGIFAGEQMGGRRGADTYQYVIQNKGGNLKIAGKANAKKIYEELKKTDPMFKLDAEKYGGTYDKFNKALVDHNRAHQVNIDKFYDALKAKGYAGIKDQNDLKFSGYRAKNAVIYFDKFKDLSVDSVRKMETSELKDAYKKAYKYVNRDALFDSVAPQALAVGSISAYAKSKESEKLTEELQKIEKRKRRNV